MSDTRYSEMPFLEHLRELRKRLIVGLSMILAGTMICYSVAPLIFRILCRPYYSAFPPGSLIGTGPAEAVMLRIHVSIFAGVVLTSPLLFHQIWLFIRPGLHDNEKKLFFPFLFITSALFLTGILFSYFIILPLSMSFFQEQYGVLELAPQVRMSEHLSLILHLLIAFGIIFEMPVLAWFLSKTGTLRYSTMRSWGRYAVVVIFLAATVLTPPDVVSQLCMAFPLLILYGISLLIVRVAEPAK